MANGNATIIVGSARLGSAFCVCRRKKIADRIILEE